MSKAWLGLGANMGAPSQQLARALDLIASHKNITLTAQSDILVNPAWGKTDQNDFHNMVVKVETALTPMQLLNACQEIETDMGRVRQEKWGPRLIDIDIIAFERLIMQTRRLTLPHPYAAERNFVLDPLREISPNMADWIVGQRNASISLTESDPKP